MKPKDWMGVVVRGLGLWFLAQSLLQFITLISITIRPMKEGGFSPVEYVFGVITYALPGLIIIATANSICDLMYPTGRHSDPE